MQIVEILLFIVWGVFIAYWLVSAWRDRSPFKRTSSRLSVLTFTGVPWVIFVLFADLFAPWLLVVRILPDSLPVVIAGLLITCTGLGFAVWARVHLGKFWSGLPAIRMDHRIIRTGPYRIVRHPIYTGLLTGIAGTAIATGLLWVICLTGIILLVFTLKIRMEEHFLQEEFGEEYAQYKREVRALIPFMI
jgi:protein-S-isoprenylcysteine O-methyltransferase Ste14